jgi:hypothetical protein
MKLSKSSSFMQRVRNEMACDKSSNDFLILPKSSENEDKVSGRHFQIKYVAKEKKYFVKDLGVGYGIFAEIAKPIVLRDSLLINICQTYIVINLSHLLSYPILKIKIFGGESQDDQYTFSPHSHQKILLGRSEFCDIQIKDKMLSRVQ